MHVYTVGETKIHGGSELWLGTGLSESKASLLTQISPPSDLEGSGNLGYWALHFFLSLAPEYWLTVSSVVCSMASNTTKQRVQKPCPQKTYREPQCPESQASSLSCRSLGQHFAVRDFHFSGDTWPCLKTFLVCTSAGM